jgi:SMC interacting uncharacterized protein involved in chromosome segregation
VTDASEDQTDTGPVQLNIEDVLAELQDQVQRLTSELTVANSRIRGLLRENEQLKTKPRPKRTSPKS